MVCVISIKLPSGTLQVVKVVKAVVWNYKKGVREKKKNMKGTE